MYIMTKQGMLEFLLSLGCTLCIIFGWLFMENYLPFLLERKLNFVSVLTLDLLWLVGMIVVYKYCMDRVPCKQA